MSVSVFAQLLLCCMKLSFNDHFLTIGRGSLLTFNAKCSLGLGGPSRDSSLNKEGVFDRTGCLYPDKVYGCACR